MESQEIDGRLVHRLMIDVMLGYRATTSDMEEMIEVQCSLMVCTDMGQVMCPLGILCHLHHAILKGNIHRNAYKSKILVLVDLPWYLEEGPSPSCMTEECSSECFMPNST